MTGGSCIQDKKNLDILRESGTLLRELLQDVDFVLDDNFCDVEEIKTSWENTHMPDGLLTLFSSLFNIPKAQMANIQSVVGVDEYLDNDLDLGGENNRSIKNLNAKLHCIFQIMTYHIHRGRKKTLMHGMVGHST